MGPRGGDVRADDSASIRLPGVAADLVGARRGVDVGANCGDGTSGTEAGGTPDLAAQLAILAEGAQTTAAISGDSAAAGQARRAAAVLIDAGMKPEGQPAPERTGRATG